MSWDAKKQQVVVRWLENDDAMQEVRLSPKALRDSDPHDGSFTNPQAPQAAASHDAAAGGGHVHGPGCGHTEAEQRGDFDTDALLAKAAKVEPEPAVIPLSIDPRGNYAVNEGAHVVHTCAYAYSYAHNHKIMEDMSFHVFFSLLLSTSPLKSFFALLSCTCAGANQMERRVRAPFL